MVASIEKSSTQGFRKQKNKIVIRHSLKADMNPSIPDEGEIVFATDTKDLLIGDGITKIESLSPINVGGGSNLPDQTGHAGEFLSTNGSEVSWSATPQSDWTQTDASAPDYIKNKPYIPSGVIVDQTYSPTSNNAQAGIAVAEAVAGKVDANTAITGGTATKITYDSKGLVTAGSSLEASDIPDLSATYQSLLVSGTNIKTINNESILGNGNLSIQGNLPSQTGQSGKFLTTNGTDASWAIVPGGGGGSTITLRDWLI